MSVQFQQIPSTYWMELKTIIKKKVISDYCRCHEEGHRCIYMCTINTTSSPQEVKSHVLHLYLHFLPVTQNHSCHSSRVLFHFHQIRRLTSEVEVCTDLSPSSSIPCALQTDTPNQSSDCGDATSRRRFLVSWYPTTAEHVSTEC